MHTINDANTKRWICRLNVENECVRNLEKLCRFSRKNGAEGDDVPSKAMSTLIGTASVALEQRKLYTSYLTDKIIAPLKEQLDYQKNLILEIDRDIQNSHQDYNRRKENLLKVTNILHYLGAFPPWFVP